MKMRDSNRIPAFCYKLAKLWEEFPDWRFGQLISNLTDRKDIFYIEDEDLFEQMENKRYLLTCCNINDKEEITNTIEPHQMSIFDIYKNLNIKSKELEIHLGESKNE